MKIYSYEAPATVGILSMFVFSGVSKLFSPKTQMFDVDRLQKAFLRLSINLPRSLFFYLLLFVGIFEIAASGLILYDVFFDEKSKGRLSSRSKMATFSLIAFTSLVTLMFYVFPPKWRALLSNISTVSGLLFLYQIIVRNTIQTESTIPNETIKRVEKLMKQKGKWASARTGMGMSWMSFNQRPMGATRGGRDLLFLSKWNVFVFEHLQIQCKWRILNLLLNR